MDSASVQPAPALGTWAGRGRTGRGETRDSRELIEHSGTRYFDNELSIGAYVQDSTRGIRIPRDGDTFERRTRVHNSWHMGPIVSFVH